MKRGIAYRFWIRDLSQGDYVAGGTIDNPTHVKIDGVLVSRVNLVGKVAEKDANSITIKDKTGKIRVRTFGDDSMIKGVSIGDLVRVIGKIRQDQTERFVLGEIIKKLDDANYQLLREKELGDSLVEEVSF